MNQSKVYGVQSPTPPQSDCLDQDNGVKTLLESKAEAQRLRVLKALQSGPKTSVQLRALGVFQTSTRVFELRKQGHEIVTERALLFDEHGYPHSRVARYTLKNQAYGPVPAKATNELLASV